MLHVAEQQFYFVASNLAGGNMSADDNTDQWLSVAAAARHMGLSRQAIQNRIKRGRIEHRLDNRGNPIVRVAATTADSVSGATGFVSGATGATAQTTRKSVLLPVAPDTFVSVAGDIAATEPAVLPPVSPGMMPVSAHLAELERLQQAHSVTVGVLRESISMATERADAAECRAERTEERLGEILSELLDQRRPWWSRWLGPSSRSNLRGEG